MAEQVSNPLFKAYRSNPALICCNYFPLLKVKHTFHMGEELDKTERIMGQTHPVSDEE
jgi:hypothetical protein